MKKILILVFVTCSLSCNAQVKTVKPEQSVNLYLTRAHTEFKLGTITVAAGLMFVGLHTFVWSKERTADGKPYKDDPKYWGLGLITVGTAINIHAFRPLNKAMKK